MAVIRRSEIIGPQFFMVHGKPRATAPTPNREVLPGEKVPAFINRFLTDLRISTRDHLSLNSASIGNFTLLLIQGDDNYRVFSVRMRFNASIGSATGGNLAERLEKSLRQDADERISLLGTFSVLERAGSHVILKACFEASIKEFIPEETKSEPLMGDPPLQSTLQPFRLRPLRPVLPQAKEVDLSSLENDALLLKAADSLISRSSPNVALGRMIREKNIDALKSEVTRILSALQTENEYYYRSIIKEPEFELLFERGVIVRPAIPLHQWLRMMNNRI